MRTSRLSADICKTGGGRGGDRVCSSLPPGEKLWGQGGFEEAGGGASVGAHLPAVW